MYFAKTKFLVVGMSKSGRAACGLLLNYGARVRIFDSAPDPEVAKGMKDLERKGATIVSASEVKEAVRASDVIVLSPGVPVDNDVPAFAVDEGKCVMGELELGYLTCRAPIVAITGTNGKTTTCSIVYDILKKAGIKSVLCGNVGTPITSVVRDLDENTVAVVEVSSFQLETTRKFAPHIACILNITPDHLSRHYNMENYVYLKSKILAGLGESEYAVLSADDETVSGLAANTKAKKIMFSAKKQTNGAYVLNDRIYWRGREIAAVSDLKLKGIHNVENALAAVCIAKILGVDDKMLGSVLAEFAGVRHRQETIAESDGVTFIDDSKATNPDSALKAVDTCSGNTILLVGGIDKGFGYNVFFSKVLETGKVKALVLYGQSRRELYRAAENAGFENIYLSVGFDSAVRTAFGIAKSGDTVLLSPACSSFDEFSGFEERGDSYATLIKKLIAEKTSDEIEKTAVEPIMERASGDGAKDAAMSREEPKTIEPFSAESPTSAACIDKTEKSDDDFDEE